MKITLLTLIFVTTGCPAILDIDSALARPLRMTCEIVRSYVAEVGMVQARATAVAAGMTGWQERLARRCLVDKIEASK